jgi:hypothetical protein
MNPFRYPGDRHTRAQTPGPFGDYHRYKVYLRAEFRRQCVYCRLPDGPKGQDTFGVDHYKPVSRFPRLRASYSNLFYSCNPCNRRKGDFWPTRTQRAKGIFMPNPCDHTMAEHLAYRGARVDPISRAGELTVELLMLNDEVAIGYREFVLRSIERCLDHVAAISETLLVLTPRLRTARGREREDLELDLSVIRNDLVLLGEDFERLTGTRLPGSVE